MAGRLQNSSHAFPPCNLQNLSLLDSLFKNSYTSNHSQSFAYLQMRFDLKAVTWEGKEGAQVFGKDVKIRLVALRTGLLLKHTEPVLHLEDPSVT